MIELAVPDTNNPIDEEQLIYGDLNMFVVLFYFYGNCDFPGCFVVVLVAGS
jgi:hypothetical protein